jgi:hypothetical protein
MTFAAAMGPSAISPAKCSTAPSTTALAAATPCLEVVEGLERCSLQPLPPRLLLLDVSKAPPEQDVPRQVWRRLQRRLATSGVR